MVYRTRISLQKTLSHRLVKPESCLLKYLRAADRFEPARILMNEGLQYLRILPQSQNGFCEGSGTDKHSICFVDFTHAFPFYPSAYPAGEIVCSWAFFKPKTLHYPL